MAGSQANGLPVTTALTGEYTINPLINPVYGKSMDQSFAAFLSVLDHPFWHYFCTETNLLAQPVDDISVRFEQKCPG